MKTFHALALGAALLAPVSAHAGSSDGKWQIKVLGSAVLPDGKITKVERDLIGLPTGSQAKASNNAVPTLAAESSSRPISRRKRSAAPAHTT